MVSSAEESTLTSNQDVVAQFNEEFKDRYTEKDADYQAILSAKEATPPVIPNDRDHKEDSSHSKRGRSRSRSRSPNGAGAKREGAFGNTSFFVFHY